MRASRLRSLFLHPERLDWQSCLTSYFVYHSPVLLVRKAQKLRKTTGDERYYAPLETKKMSFGKRLESILGKPFVLLFREPMLIAVTVYMSVGPSRLRHSS